MFATFFGEIQINIPICSASIAWFLPIFVSFIFPHHRLQSVGEIQIFPTASLGYLLNIQLWSVQNLKSGHFGLVPLNPLFFSGEMQFVKNKQTWFSCIFRPSSIPKRPQERRKSYKIETNKIVRFCSWTVKQIHLHPSLATWWNDLIQINSHQWVNNTIWKGLFQHGFNSMSTQWVVQLFLGK